MISEFSEGNTLKSELPLTYNITYDPTEQGIVVTLKYGEITLTSRDKSLHHLMPIDQLEAYVSILLVRTLKESDLIHSMVAQLFKAIAPREDVMPSSVNSFNPNTGDWSPCYSCPFYSRTEHQLPLTNTFNGPTRSAWAYTCAKSCWDKSIHKHVDQAKSFSGKDCSVYRDLIKNTKLGVSS